MIVLITSRGHGNTLRSMRRGTFGVATPDIRTTDYETLYRTRRLPRATYIFSDFERLLPFELQLAADLYRRMKALGLRCLNDPANVMSRVELLSTLQRRGLHPFGCYRADENPEPCRFPVFIRTEMGHALASEALYADQDALDGALAKLRADGAPLRGMLVTELVAEPYREGLWAKWGSWRIGDETIIEHIAVDDHWLVKNGDHGKVSPEVAQDEHDAVMTNRHAEALAPIFKIAHVDYGRADHGRFAGRTIVYEINSNPYIGSYVPDSNPLRRETQLFARKRLSEALSRIDTPVGGRVTLHPQRPRRRWPWSQLVPAGPARP